MSMTNRELDALVAEKVMGWERVGKKFSTRPLHRKSRDYPGEIINDFSQKGPHDYLRRPEDPDSYVAFCGCESTTGLPHYSTSIADAWQVVERMREKGFKMRLDYMLTHPKCEFVYNRPRNRSFGTGYRCYSEKNVTVAICLSALEAMGHEVKP